MTKEPGDWSRSCCSLRPRQAGAWRSLRMEALGQCGVLSGIDLRGESESGLPRRTPISCEDLEAVPPLNQFWDKSRDKPARGDAPHQLGLAAINCARCEPKRPAEDSRPPL